MIRNQKVTVVMPAYNAEKTLLKTYREIVEQEIVDLIIVVDDGSKDQTVSIARKLENVQVYRHERNMGYGANQKTCYRIALENESDMVIMVHPDYQYTPKLIPAMAAMIANGLYDCVLGSRILGGYAIKGGMPKWKYVANRFLTFFENAIIGSKLSEFHTGYRAFSRKLLESIDFEHNSDNFVFDNEMLLQIIWYGFTIAEISCPTKYFEDASSIDFTNSLVYGTGCIKTAFEFRIANLGRSGSRLFPVEKLNKYARKC